MKYIPFYNKFSNTCLPPEQIRRESSRSDPILRSESPHTYGGCHWHFWSAAAHMDHLLHGVLILVMLLCEINGCCVLHTLTYQTRSMKRYIYKIWAALNVETASVSFFPDFLRLLFIFSSFLFIES